MRSISLLSEALVDPTLHAWWLVHEVSLTFLSIWAHTCHFLLLQHCAQCLHMHVSHIITVSCIVFYVLWSILHLWKYLVKSSVFCDITPYSPLKVNQSFGYDIFPQRRLTFNRLHGVVFHKIKLFITTAVRTSKPAIPFMLEPCSHDSFYLLYWLFYS
jgi:hypothetical protein